MKRPDFHTKLGLGAGCLLVCLQVLPVAAQSASAPKTTKETVSSMNALFEQICLPMWDDQSLESAEARIVAAGFVPTTYDGGLKAPNGVFPNAQAFIKDNADMQIIIGTGEVSGKNAFGAKGGHICSVQADVKNDRVSGWLLPLQDDRDKALNHYRISTSSPWTRKSGPSGGTFGTGTTPPSLYLIKHF